MDNFIDMVGYSAIAGEIHDEKWWEEHSKKLRDNWTTKKRNSSVFS
jgi:hypothetical protein